MTITRRAFALSGLAVAALSSRSLAQTPASGRILVGFPAGGTADSTTRRFAELARGRIASAVVVENRVGAGGRLAIQALKGAPADGTTLLLSPDSMMTIYTSVYRNLGYDPATDVTPISPICRYAFAFGVGPRVPRNVTSLSDFVAWGKANNDAVTYGSPAAGSMPHFLGDLFFRAAGIKAVHSPYRGSAPAINDLLGGHIPCVMTVLGDFLPHVNADGVRMLGVTTEERSGSCRMCRRSAKPASRRWPAQKHTAYSCRRRVGRVDAAGRRACAGSGGEQGHDRRSGAHWHGRPGDDQRRVSSPPRRGTRAVGACGTGVGLFA